jgi:hypothetical protein
MKTLSVSQLNTTINNSKNTDNNDVVFTYCATDEAQVRLIGNLEEAAIDNVTFYKVDVGSTPPIFAVQHLPAVTVFKGGVKSIEFAVDVDVEVSSLLSALNNSINIIDMS